MCVIAQNVTVEVVYHNEFFTACHVPVLSMIGHFCNFW